MTQQNKDDPQIATTTPQSQTFETEINGQDIVGTIKCVGKKFHITLKKSGITLIISQKEDGQLKAISGYWPKTGFGLSMLAMEAALKPIILRFLADEAVPDETLADETDDSASTVSVTNETQRQDAESRDESLPPPPNS